MGLSLDLLLILSGLALQANCSYLKYCHSGKSFFPSVRTKGSGDPLILTPYVENGKIEEGKSLASNGGGRIVWLPGVHMHFRVLTTARNLSQVKGVGNFPSYSGEESS